MSALLDTPERLLVRAPINIADGRAWSRSETLLDKPQQVSRTDSDILLDLSPRSDAVGNLPIQKLLVHFLLRLLHAGLKVVEDL